MKFIELPLSSGEKVLVNPQSIAYLILNTETSCIIHFIGNIPEPLEVEFSFKKMMFLLNKSM